VPLYQSDQKSTSLHIPTLVIREALLTELC
jgi:hypothetical protein